MQTDKLKNKFFALEQWIVLQINALHRRLQIGVDTVDEKEYLDALNTQIGEIFYSESDTEVGEQKRTSETDN